MRTHFEAWCKAWRDIGVAHAFGMLKTHEAIQQAQMDAFIYGTGHLRLTKDGIERVPPDHVFIDESATFDLTQRNVLLRYSNLQVRYPDTGLVEDLSKKWWTP